MITKVFLYLKQFKIIFPSRLFSYFFVIGQHIKNNHIQKSVIVYISNIISHGGSARMSHKLSQPLRKRAIPVIDV